MFAPSEFGLRLRQGSPLVRTMAAIAALVTIAGWIAILVRPEKHTVTGDLALDSTSFSSLNPGDSCDGTDGYDDITAGAQVVITDGAGTTLQTGSLDAGVYDGQTCDFSLSLRNVPNASFYRVQIGNALRRGVEYSQAEMSKQHWRLALTLGDGS